MSAGPTTTSATHIQRLRCIFVSSSPSPCTVDLPAQGGIDQFWSLEPQVGSLLFRAGMAQPGQHFPIKSRKSDFRWRADVQVLVQGAFAVVRHQDLHLPFGQILDLLVLGAVLAFLPLRRAHALLETLEAEELLPNQGLRPARDRVLGGCADEVSRGFLILGA